MSYALIIAALFGTLPTIDPIARHPSVTFGDPVFTGIADGPMCQPDPVLPVDPPTHLGVLLMDAATPDESAEVTFQIQQCSRRVTRVADPFMVLALLRLEQDLGAPKGVLASAWCWETAMRPVPVRGDAGASHGFFQMQGWFWDACGLPMVDRVTLDLPMAATCYFSRVQQYLDDGKCPGNVTRAEALAANGPKYASHGCKAKSLHAAELARWRSARVRPQFGSAQHLP